MKPYLIADAEAFEAAFARSTRNDVRSLRKPDVGAALPIATLRGSAWAKEGAKGGFPHAGSSNLSWFVECQIQGMRVLRSIVEIDADKCGGLPVLTGTRFTIAQVLAELADTNGADEVAEEFDLDADAIRQVLNGMSLAFQKPLAGG